MVRLIAAIALLFTALPAAAKPDETKAVLAAVDRFLAAVNADDPAALAASQHSSGMTYAVIYGPDGKITVRPRSNAEWVERSGKSGKKYQETYWSPKVTIHRDMAVFWAPYSFDIDGKRSHCGVDVFNLIRIDGTWKVTNAMWSIEPDGCGKQRGGS